MQHYYNYNLTIYNSFTLKSKAKKIWFPANNHELQSVLMALKGQKFYVLSYGTNVLLNRTINKIICLRNMPNKIMQKDNIFIVQANTNLNQFTSQIIYANYSGVEGLIGIPGSVGAAIYGNSGSGPYCISNYLESIKTIDFNGKVHEYSKNKLEFQRRYCNLQNKSEIILNAIFKFDKQGINQDIINKTLEYRNTLPKYPSIGGIFKNWYALKPYEQQLIGLKVGNAEVSKKVNIIINKGNATYSNVVNLIQKIRHIVKEPLYLEVKIFE